MKKHKILFSFLALLTLLVVIVGNYSCERDDICPPGTPTTPLLIIKFFDNITRIDPKAPENLSIKAVDVEELFVSEFNQDSIGIPLKTNVLITEFEFTIEQEETTNTDTLSFEYTPVEEYVNSACGFRVTFEGLTNSLVAEDGGTNWIKEIVIQEPNVTDETITHIYIYH
ncbi:DUF6452 family protein [Aquimarina brevivitae]|uniref:Uncharacterized protein n=1 Tax=Aquimarina brevivitae TaxID=323412 RepID=A0A4Q7NTG0_9FLAO|nr:DUF6452 family protein [Aquimarina brevivitae]RZS90431.1 hypothetical protein EV197_3416 [Aquimarina brevivitae]